MSNWTYDQLTKKTEKSINRMMANASRCRIDHIEETARLYEQWSFGAFELWDQITFGWQAEGDRERLLMMTEGEGGV